MPRDFINIGYQIQFETPFHLGTGLRRGLLDRSVCRDANGYLYIPGSTLKGVLREKCEQIARVFDLCAVSPHNEREAIDRFRDDTDIVDRIFGSRYKPGELYFDNANLIEEDQRLFDSDSDRISERYIHLQTETRMQTSISRTLGTVREQALLQSEFGIRTLCFEGEVYGHLEGFRIDEKNPWSYSLLLLVAGICANDRIGTNKSTGMGRYSCEILELEINDAPIETANLLAKLSDLEYYQAAQEDAK